jgi:hypothetical protein
MSEEIKHNGRGDKKAAAMTAAASQLGVTGCVVRQTTCAAAQQPLTDRRFVINFLVSGLEAFAFTFG